MPVAFKWPRARESVFENGPIAAGDPLTSSSVPGVAMKATASGYVIGKALESFDELGIRNKELGENIDVCGPGLVHGADRSFGAGKR